MKARLYSLRPLAALLCLCGVAWWQYVPVMEEARANPSIFYNSDNDDIYWAARSATAEDVAGWWTGPWLLGQERAFYRPLTSIGFALQARVFGTDDMPGFMALHFAFYLCTLAAAYWFLQTLAGGRLAVLSLALFVLDITKPMGLPYTSGALQNWYDNPEMWFMTPLLLAAGCWVQALRTQSGRWLAGAFILFVIAVLFKETAYVFLLLAVLVAWHERKLPVAWRSLAALWCLGFALLAFRTWALSGTGYRNGHNDGWWNRALVDAVGGRPLLVALTHDYLPLGVTTAVAGAVAAWRRRWGWAAICGVAACACVVVTARLFPRSIGDTLALFFQAQEWQYAAMTCVLLFGYGVAVWRRDRTQLFAYGWVLAAMLPVIAAPNRAHVYFAVSLPWCLFIAWTLREMGRSIIAVVPGTSHFTPFQAHAGERANVRALRYNDAHEAPHSRRSHPGSRS